MYKVIALDPPWKTDQGGGKIKRGADAHYDLLSTPEILDVVQSAKFADGSTVFDPDPEGCFIWMWSTMRSMKEALWLLEKLGADYITNMAWVKGERQDGNIVKLNGFGLGYYLRGLHEIALMGRIGKTRTASRKTPSVLISPRRKHSEKPDEFYTAIENIAGGGPYLEMFARKERPGWDVWGNEV